MQIVLGFIVIFILLIFIIYKINKKFEARELFILSAIIAAIISAYLVYNECEENRLPNLFKQKYFETKNIEIQKLSYKELNNLDISSKSKFVYDFDYIIQKDEKIFLCSVKNVEISKIDDEYVFPSFYNMQEECVEQ